METSKPQFGPLKLGSFPWAGLLSWLLTHVLRWLITEFDIGLINREEQKGLARESERPGSVLCGSAVCIFSAPYYLCLWNSVLVCTLRISL